MLNVEYLDHCGYVVESDVAIYIFDYVKGNLPSQYLKSEKPTYFFVTSADVNHFNDSIFSYRKPVCMSYDVLASPFNRVLQVSPQDTIHLGFARINVFATTREGVCYVIEEAKQTIMHGGDLNDWHWSALSSKEQVEEEHLHFLDSMRQFEKFKGIDLMMFAVDPRLMRDYDIGARYAISQLKPKNFFAMHFGDDSTALESFKQWTTTLVDTRVFIPSYTNQSFKNID